MACMVTDSIMHRVIHHALRVTAAVILIVFAGVVLFTLVFSN